MALGAFIATGVLVSAMAVQPAGAQGFTGIDGGQIDPGLTWDQVIDRSWTAFIDNCKLAMNNPNALIAKAGAGSTQGRPDWISQTADEKLIEVNIGEPNIFTQAHFVTMSDRAHLDCQTYGFWLQSFAQMDPYNPAQALEQMDIDIVTGRFFEHLDRRGGVQIVGGEPHAVVGTPSHGGMLSPPMSVEGGSVEIRTSAYGLRGIWPEVDVIAVAVISSTHIVLSAQRQIGAD